MAAAAAAAETAKKGTFVEQEAGPDRGGREGASFALRRLSQQSTLEADRSRRRQRCAGGGSTYLWRGGWGGL